MLRNVAREDNEQHARLNASLLQLKQLLRDVARMHRLDNYTDILRQLNITEEYISYLNGLTLGNGTFFPTASIFAAVAAAAAGGASSIVATTSTTSANGSASATLTSSAATGSTGSSIAASTMSTLPCNCNGYVRDLAITYRLYHGYVALMVCAFGTIANLLNIIVLTRKDLASTPINRILTGLAIADMLVMIEYVPFAIYFYLVLPEQQIFPYGWAVFILFHMHFTQVFHTISIALTLTLAVWRYIAIRYPQYNHCWCTAARCRFALWCSILAPLIACVPSCFVFVIKAEFVYENGTSEVLYHVDTDYSSEKGFLYRLNFWVLGVVIKLLPCTILTIISCWLIKALYRVKGRKRALKNYGQSAAAIPKMSNGVSDVRKPSKSEKRTDRTTRMLVAVLLLFLVTEIPQGVLGLLSGVLGDCFFRNCYHNFGEIMDILALLNGAINFILYCSMSRQFRTTFGQLFKPKIIKKWHPPIQHTDVQSTYV